jgi:hypothetical protein
MLKRFVALSFALLAIHGCTIFSAAFASDANAASLVDDGTQITVTAKEEAPTFFKSGAKYDSATHQWKDRYNGKTIDLGLPGVAGRYGCQNLIADNDVIAAGPGSGGTTNVSSNNHNYKQWLILTLLGLGIATSIAVPIAVGVHYHHNHHHQQIIWQRNQVASYYFFHNQTLPIPKLILPPPPPVEHSAPPPPPPGN